MVSEIRLVKDSIFEDIQDTLEGIRSKDKPITRVFDSKDTADNLSNLFTILGHSCEVQEVKGVNFGAHPYIKYILKITVTDGKNSSDGSIKRVDRQYKKRKVYDTFGVLL